MAYLFTVTVPPFLSALIRAKLSRFLFEFHFDRAAAEPAQGRCSYLSTLRCSLMTPEKRLNRVGWNAGHNRNTFITEAKSFQFSNS